MTHPVPALRITAVNEAPVRRDGDHVVYWMIATRRARYNFGLDRAIGRAVELGKPLIVLEALRCDYPWASDRLHRFVLAGMADNAAAFHGSAIRYFPYVEDQVGAGRGLLAALAKRACVVVTDDFPCFFLPRMVAAAARRLSVLVEQVDSNGLLPMRAPGDRVFARAFDFRRWLQEHLAPHVSMAPRARPLTALNLPRASLPRAITSRWPVAPARLLRGEPAALAKLPIDHSVAPVERVTGGSVAAGDQLRAFLERGLARYDEDRNHPGRDGSSGLSPWLHFGHLSVHEVFARLARRSMNAPAEAFLDQLVTWRELGFNMCSHRRDYDRYESLPQWAQQTLGEHVGDPRPHLYTIDELRESRTHDELWDAAQSELRRDGRIHNYLRMLWGKKVLEWSPSPRAALAILVELNNRYALDGRDPNSYSGIFWVFGRYDRAWGPERPVFGKIRYMTSANTRRKFRLDSYLAKFGASPA